MESGLGTTAAAERPQTTAPRRVRVAVIGCGAVTKANLLPVLAGHDGVTVAALVDRDLGRAQALARAYSVPRAVTDLDPILDEIDAVVLATPPSHHAEATLSLVARGKHVLVEKPMATSLVDAAAMVDAADRARVALSVGLYRRMLPSVRLLRTLLESGDYGRPLAVDAEEGGPYGWQLATMAVLTKAGGGGGVLIDIGSHVIDAILFALPGAPRLHAYADNARGGIETDSVLEASLTLGGREIPLRVELSRTRELRGSIRVECERATLELERANFTHVLIHPIAGADEEMPSPIRISAEWRQDGAYVGYQAFRDEIDDWVSAIGAGRDPVLSGRSVLPVVRLIEACYQQRSALDEPWVDEGLRPDQPSIHLVSSRRRVVVTGAGGFLGGRATEILRERHGWDVVPLVHEPKSAARLARWPQDIRVGNVCSASDMDRALAGCDAVVHCAVGTSWKAEETRRVTVDGTRTVAEAALRNGVRRFVHISSMFVHRRDGGDVLDERTALEPPAEDGYAQNKLAAERALAGVFARGLSGIILRPTRIYGPFSKTFTTSPLRAISNGTFAISGDPDVPANMVYVDNVVHAIAQAIEAPDTLGGQAYLISDPEQVSLREFYQFFADTAGLCVRIAGPRPPLGTKARRPGFTRGWIEGLRTIALAPEVRALVHRVLDTDPVGTVPRRLWERSPDLQARLLRLFKVDAAVTFRPAPARATADLLYYGEPARVSSARAHTDLNYDAAVAPRRAMELTRDWARTARLI
jgi:predicted dehydrogenase/nucleoside-diphosphate-sugar epimerase